MKIQSIGARIRKMMEEKKVSMEELVERTGLDKAFLLSVLDHDVIPSLGPLAKIARVLGTRIGTFMDDQEGVDPLIIRRQERKSEVSMLSTRGGQAVHKFYSLGKGKVDRHMEPFFVELMPEGGQEANFSSHEGEEFIVVYSGQVEVVYGKETYHLNAGDSIYYNSIVPHSVRAVGDHLATLYAVLYSPQ